MIKISREEVLKIAQISHIALHEDEVQPMINELENVLNYAQRVIDIAGNGNAQDMPSTKNINVFRPDQNMPQEADVLLAQAPERADRYFVVPKILDN